MRYSGHGEVPTRGIGVTENYLHEVYGSCRGTYTRYMGHGELPA